MQRSMSLEYEPASEPLHVSVKRLCGVEGGRWRVEGEGWRMGGGG